MRRFLTTSAVLVLFFLAAGSRALLAQVDGAGGASADPRTVSVSPSASKEEVEELRNEVAVQQQTIEELKAMVQRLVKQQGSDDARVVNAAVIQQQPEQVEEPLDVAQKSKGTTAPLAAGWNGEHFFIRSADGQFQIQPYGYVQTDFRSYMGDGAPPDTFAVRRGRFGFQGNYGDHYQFGILVDAASTSGATIRDVYLNLNFNNAFQIQGGQFKEPFAQEEITGVTNIDFVERGLQSLLYPSAASAFRSPGVTIHGDINGGVMQYWAGAFNGKGFSTLNTTSVPETVGRVRFYPWRHKNDSALHGFAFGGSIAYSMSRGLSNEVTAPMAMPDAAYTWLPQFPVNGNVWRYEGEFTYLKGPWGFRDEYVRASYSRTGVGTEQLGGIGFANLPNVKYQAWDSSVTYLLTKELRPENGTPRVKHPVFGPATEGGGGRGWGAWELGFRYSGIQGNEPGIFFNNVYTPELVPTYDMHTDQFTFGVNWYLNYWVRFQSSVDIDRLRQPSTIGATPQNYFVFEQRLQYRF